MEGLHGNKNIKIVHGKQYRTNEQEIDSKEYLKTEIWNLDLQWLIWKTTFTVMEIRENKLGQRQASVQKPAI